ncbi:Ltp family lipoprotein [Porcipelethomonas ammoniilytica]|uniref:Ltp family lipoprotein n=1 Tax=Porcipelethomonas ammoniilytica TaxID=2981722 RepID=UPI00082081B4|nr:Ltp family lipoprotein [Porcipelethomonas ammoniilytica]MCU6720713.1 Ltp family lipoprotein [Porcipelethomonas ammoniilytica]SCJ22606.1 Host cell surface-exposed lipoprotein [uncultured Ruminococcus sp.]
MDNKVNVNSYLNTALSPYRLNEDAMELIEHLCENFSQEVEEKALILINSASLHPNMSRYQLSLTHKALGDCYYKHNIFQSALEQYNRAISYNSKISVKRRIKKLLAIPSDKRTSSLSPDIISDVLQFPEYKELLELERDQTQNELDTLWCDDLESRALMEQARKEIVLESEQKKSIYDLEYEAKIKRRLNALGEPYKSEFYRLREERQLTKKTDDILSIKDYELLDLESMEQSATFNKNIVTTQMKEALSLACHFIKMSKSIELSGKSYQGMIQFLVIGGGYTNEEAIYAADNCKADWNEQAVKTAKYYKNNYPSQTSQEIIDQLIFEGFTESQAKYGVNYVMTNNDIKGNSLP